MPSTSWPSIFSKVRRESQNACRSRTEVNRARRLLLFLFAVQPRHGDGVFGLLLPFVGNGVLINQSIKRIQEPSAPAVVVKLVHVMSTLFARETLASLPEFSSRYCVRFFAVFR